MVLPGARWRLSAARGRAQGGTMAGKFVLKKGSTGN
jgi:hypothetical protein